MNAENLTWGMIVDRDAENAALKERVRELEVSVTYCIETDKESQSENNRLREALENIINETENEDWKAACNNIHKIAREASKEGK